MAGPSRLAGRARPVGTLFAEGVQLIEDEYVQRATGIRDPIDLWVPEACELMAFWSTR